MVSKKCKNYKEQSITYNKRLKKQSRFGLKLPSKRCRSDQASHIQVLVDMHEMGKLVNVSFPVGGKWSLTHRKQLKLCMNFDHHRQMAHDFPPRLEQFVSIPPFSIRNLQRLFSLCTDETPQRFEIHPEVG